MGFWENVGYAGAGAAEALRQLEEDRRRDADLRSLIQARVAQDELQRWLLNERVRENTVRERERGEDRKLQNAHLTLSVLDSMHDPTSSTPLEISPEQRTALTNTPYAMRVKDEQTLPARATATGLVRTRGPVGGGQPEDDNQVLSVGPTIDPTPQPYSYLRPTSAQQEQRRTVVQGIRRRGDFDRLRNDRSTPAKVRTLMDLENAGIEAAPITASLLETPADRQAEADRAFGEFQRREKYQDSLIRGRQSHGGGGITAKDRLEARRQARRDAIAEYNARKDVAGIPTVDLSELIDQYESEAMDLLDQLETNEHGNRQGGGRVGAQPSVAAPSGLVPFAPLLSHTSALEGTPQKGPRVVKGLMRVSPKNGPRAADPETMPRRGETRVINGQLAQWDGRGWLPVQQ